MSGRKLFEKGEVEMIGKKWFDVTVRESYHHSYRVLARDEQEADDLVNAMVNNGDVDPTQDGCQSYERETGVDKSGPPEEGGEYWEFEGDEPMNYQYGELKETKASKKRRRPK